MRLHRIPQRVSTCLFPFSSHFTCPRGEHFRVWCWLLVTLLLVDGSARLKNLTRYMPESLRYWTVRRMVIAGYWDASALLHDLALAALRSLQPPADGRLHLIADKTIKQKSGKKQPLTRRRHPPRSFAWSQSRRLHFTATLTASQFGGQCYTPRRTEFAVDVTPPNSIAVKGAAPWTLDRKSLNRCWPGARAATRSASH